MDRNKYYSILSYKPVSYKETQWGILLYDKFGEQVGTVDSVDVANNIISESRNSTYKQIESLKKLGR